MERDRSARARRAAAERGRVGDGRSHLYRAGWRRRDRRRDRLALRRHADVVERDAASAARRIGGPEGEGGRPRSGGGLDRNGNGMPLHCGLRVVVAVGISPDRRPAPRDVHRRARRTVIRVARVREGQDVWLTDLRRQYLRDAARMKAVDVDRLGSVVGLPVALDQVDRVTDDRPAGQAGRGRGKIRIEGARLLHGRHLEAAVRD